MTTTPRRVLLHAATAARWRRRDGDERALPRDDVAGRHGERRCDAGRRELRQLRIIGLDGVERARLRLEDLIALPAFEIRGCSRILRLLRNRLIGERGVPEIDEAGIHRETFALDHHCVRGRLHIIADGFDQSVAHHDGALRNHRPADGDNLCVANCHRGMLLSNGEGATQKECCDEFLHMSNREKGVLVRLLVTWTV